MAQRGERKCVVCGTTYIYCPNCGAGDPKDSYKYLYDTKQCEDVFNICSRYTFGYIKAAEAKKLLDKYDLSDLTNYSQGVKGNILAIKAETESAPKAEAKAKAEEEAKPETKGGKSNGNKLVNAK